MAAITVTRPTSTADDVRSILVNSCVAAVLACGLMILVHELVHLVTGLLLGYPGVLFAFGVDVGTPTNTDLAIVAISAPIFSLVTGFAMAFWLPLRERGGFAHLLWLWFAFVSIMEGVGYLVITPFGAGDTATTADALGWPFWTRLAMCGLGVGLQFLTAALFAPHVGRHAGDSKPAQLAFTLWPWLFASVVNVSLSLTYLALTSALNPEAAASFSAGAYIAVIAASTAITVFAPMAFIFKRRFAQETRPLGLRPLPLAGITGFCLLVALNLFLSRGLPVG